MVHSDDDLEKFLGPLEAEVVRAAWAAGGPVTVRAVLVSINDGRSPPLAYTTVMTVMNRLAVKDVLRRRKQGRGYVYEAVADSPAALAVRSVMRDFGDAAMANFVEQAKADPKVLRRLQRMLEDEG